MLELYNLGQIQFAVLLSPQCPGKDEICQTINYILPKCSQMWEFSGECGNRILTDEEDCECDEGTSSNPSVVLWEHVYNADSCKCSTSQC